MKLVIHTQHKENYGAHDWDGQGECPQGWKFKGGETYVVERLSERMVKRINDKGIPYLSKLIEYRSDRFEEYVTMHMIVNDDETPWDDWEVPTNLVYVDQKWNATIHHGKSPAGYRKEVLDKFESWTLGEGGEQIDRECKLKLAEGWFTWEEANKRLAEAA